jgi:hypothetical protein
LTKFGETACQTIATKCKTSIEANSKFEYAKKGLGDESIVTTTDDGAVTKGAAVGITASDKSAT